MPPASRAVSFSLITLLACSPALAQRRVSWKQLAVGASKAVGECLELAEQSIYDAKRVRAVASLQQLVDALLSPEIEKPGPIERLGSVLNFAEALPPERFPDVHRWFAPRISKAVRALRSEHLDSFRALARELWGARRKKDAAKNEVGRMLLALELKPLLERYRTDPDTTRSLGALVADLLEREVAWMDPVATKPLPLSAAVRALGAVIESPTIFPVLDGADSLYDIALTSGGPTAPLVPVITTLISCLAKIEVRVKGPRGTVLPADDKRAATQTRLWHRVLPTLQKWTGQVEYVWHQQWEEFWRIYHGEDAAQAFDFGSARDRFNGILASGTAVFVRRGDEPDLSERLRANFFEIESRAARILIILDISSSMGNPIDDDSHESRLAIFQREVIRFVRGLPAGVHFNILPFASTASIGKSLSRSHKLIPKKLPRGGVAGKVEGWIKSLRPEGKTRTDLAFREAFNVRRDGVRRGKPGSFQPEFEEIYVITDGDPTDEHGEVIDREAVEKLLEEIHAMNSRYRVRINTLGYPGHMTRFLHELAIQNGGRRKTIRRTGR